MPGSYVTIKHGLLTLYLLAIREVYTNWCENISLTIEVIIRSISSQNTGFISFPPFRLKMP